MEFSIAHFHVQGGNEQGLAMYMIDIPQVPSPAEVSASFKKLMRACTPSAPQSTYFASIQDSGWVTQLTHLMQIGGAVADLMDIQESSVLVCLENGWDATAQVNFYMWHKGQSLYSETQQMKFSQVGVYTLSSFFVLI